MPFVLSPPASSATQAHVVRAAGASPAPSRLRTQDPSGPKTPNSAQDWSVSPLLSASALTRLSLSLGSALHPTERTTVSYANSRAQKKNNN